MWILPITVALSMLLGVLITRSNKDKEVNKLSDKEKNMIIRRIKELKGRDFEIFTEQIYKLMGYKTYLTQ